MSLATNKASSSKYTFGRDKMVTYIQNQCLENRSNGRKIDMPIFYGKDSEAWFYRAELYFSMNEYSEEEK